MEKLDAIRVYLAIVDSRGNMPENDEIIQRLLIQLKKEAVFYGDQVRAKEIWCCEQISSIQCNYLQAFEAIKKGFYYDAWCLLERIEIEVRHLEPHLQSDDNDYKLGFIIKHTRQFQSLYPYNLFSSPAYIKKKELCSVCHTPISIRNPCNHIVGEIYDGEQCGKIIVEAEILEISLTPEPFCKRSVAFMIDRETNELIDHYDYSLVKYVIDKLNQPFDEWNMSWPEI